MMNRTDATELLIGGIALAAERGLSWADGTPVRRNDDETTVDTWPFLVEDAAAYLAGEFAGDQVERLVAGFLAAGHFVEPC